MRKPPPRAIVRTVDWLAYVFIAAVFAILAAGIVQNGAAPSACAEHPAATARK